MSIQPDRDLLSFLRHMRKKIESDNTPRTPSLDQLYRLLRRRVHELNPPLAWSEFDEPCKS